MIDKIVWQPEYLYSTNSYEFAINLDRKFADEMKSSKISQIKIDNMNKFAVKNFKIYSTSPYQFLDNTCLLKSIYIGNSGKWLALNNGSLNKKDEEHLIYNTHNIDSKSEAFTILGLFDLWIHCSKALTEI